MRKVTVLFEALYGCVQAVYAALRKSGKTFRFVHGSVVNTKVVHLFRKLSSVIPYLYTPTYPHQTLVFSSVKDGLSSSYTGLIITTTC